MEEDSIKYTEFSTPQGFYEWIVIPFGLKNAPRIFQRRMDDAFKHLNSFLVVYVDDILISSQTLEEHREHLKIFAETALKEGICLSEKKATIEKEKIEFLGFELGSNGISLQTHISRKISEYPDELRTKKQIQRFLGLLNYASSYIPDLAKKKKDLQSLLRKNNTRGWSDYHTQIVKKLKEECKNLPQLRLPEPEDNLIMQTDASDKVWSVVLKTDLNEICGYHSGTFSQTEENYNTMEKEILAIIRGIKKWRLFLLPKPFKVLTDNKAATTFVKQVLDNGPHMRKLHRWQTFLSQFNAVYEHVSGNNNFLADYLTREAEYLKP